MEKYIYLITALIDNRMNNAWINDYVILDHRIDSADSIDEIKEKIKKKFPLCDEVVIINYNLLSKGSLI